MSFIEFSLTPVDEDATPEDFTAYSRMAVVYTAMNEAHKEWLRERPGPDNWVSPEYTALRDIEEAVTRARFGEPRETWDDKLIGLVVTSMDCKRGLRAQASWLLRLVRAAKAEQRRAHDAHIVSGERPWSLFF